MGNLRIKKLLNDLAEKSQKKERSLAYPYGLSSDEWDAWDIAQLVCGVFGVVGVAAACTIAMTRNPCIQIIKNYMREKAKDAETIAESMMWFMDIKNCNPRNPGLVDRTKYGALFRGLLDALVKGKCGPAASAAALLEMKIIQESDVESVENEIKTLQQLSDFALDAAIAAFAVKLADNLAQTCGDLCADAAAIDLYIRSKVPSLNAEQMEKVLIILLALTAYGAAIMVIPEIAAAAATLKASLVAILVAAGVANADQMADDLINTSKANNLKCWEMEPEFVGPPSPVEDVNQTDEPPPSGYFM